MELSDRQIVWRVLEKDPAAFKDIVDKYKKKVYYIAYQMTGNHSDADDVAQEAFIKAYRRLGQFKGRSNFYTWFYRILINCCMDELRRRKRRPELDLDESLDMDRYAADAAGKGRTLDAAREAEADELRGAVAEALESIPAKQRMALVLHEFEKMPHGDIARVMKCSEGTVRSRLHYARLRMQQKLRRFIE